MKKTGTSATQVLLHALDEAYEVPAWHGTTLKGALRGVTARQAGWRPAPGRHNIRELVVHAAYWKERVRQRLTGETEAFPHSGSNWFERPGGSEKAWKEERALLDRAHRNLRRAVEPRQRDCCDRPLAPTRATGGRRAQAPRISPAL